MPTSSEPATIRSAIASDPGKIRKEIDAPAFRNILAAYPAKNSKQRHQGYAKDDPQVELIRYKQFMALHSLGDEQSLVLILPIWHWRVFGAMKPLSIIFSRLPGRK